MSVARVTAELSTGPKQPSYKEDLHKTVGTSLNTQWRPENKTLSHSLKIMVMLTFPWTRENMKHHLSV
jgi:hypothetical protein